MTGGWRQQTTMACVYLHNKSAHSAHVPQNLKYNINIYIYTHTLYFICYLRFSAWSLKPPLEENAFLLLCLTNAAPGQGGLDSHWRLQVVLRVPYTSDRKLSYLQVEAPTASFSSRPHILLQLPILSETHFSHL